MPLLPCVTLAPGALNVAYRAAETPQVLWIDVQTDGPSLAPFAFAVMAAVVDQINYGAAGSEQFDPSIGFAEVLTGPSAEDVGPSFSWVMRWCGVSPSFLRNVVERLCLAGGSQPTDRVSIRGELSVDDSALSVTTEQLSRWLDDAAAYPSRFRTEQFPFTEIPGNGMQLQVELVRTMTPEIHVELEQVVTTWIEATQQYVSDRGLPVYEGAEEYAYYSGIAKHEYRARLIEFEHATRPSADLLLNMLLRFHARVSPIASVELHL